MQWVNVADPLFQYKATHTEGGLSARSFFIHTKAEATDINQSHYCTRACVSRLVLLVTLPALPEALYVIPASLFVPPKLPVK